ncbi:MAG: hypothetical protein WBO92_02385, partial [Candidatus Moraniibacteriota bacterium]
MTNKNFTYGEAFRAGWTKLKEQWVFLLVSYATIIFVSGIFSGLAEGLYKDIEPTSSLLVLIGVFLRIWLNYNFLVITIRLFDGVKPAWRDLFAWHDEMLAYIGASILYVLIVTLGLLVFVIPGIYLAIKYNFYSLLIADKRLGAFDALKASGQLTEGVKWSLIGFSVASFGVILLGMLALLIGLFVAVPVISLAYIFVYRTLYDQTFDLATATPGTVVTSPAVDSSLVTVPESRDT